MFQPRLSQPASSPARLAAAAIALDRPELGPQRYAHSLCTPSGGARLNGGGRLDGTHGFTDGLADADTDVTEEPDAVPR